MKITLDLTTRDAIQLLRGKLDELMTYENNESARLPCYIVDEAKIIIDRLKQLYPLPPEPK